MDGEKTKALGDSIKIFVSRSSDGGCGDHGWTRPISVPLRSGRLRSRKGCCSSFRHQSERYCEETSLHGIKYACREDGIKKCYWVIILLGMMAAAAYCIHGVVHNYITTPTLVSIESTDYPIHKILFPALTICNLNKVNNKNVPPKQVDVFGRTVYTNESEWLQRVQSVLSMVYAEEPCPDGDCAGVTVDTTQQLSTEEVKKIMRLTSPSCEEMIFTCSWRGNKVPCSSIFKTHHTDFGYCCLFNSNYEDSKTSEKLYTGPGDKNGLTVMLDAKRYEYYQSQFLSVGFKVLVHGMHDEPEVRQRGLAIQPGREIFVAVGAEETYTTQRAEDGFKPEQRNCFKEHEVSLKFSDTSVYTLANCLLSHEAEALFEKCGCVAYYMPGNGEVCHEKDLSCLRGFLHKLSQDFDMSAHFWDDCLPACDETKYSTELSTFRVPQSDADQQQRIPAHLPDHHDEDLYRCPGAQAQQMGGSDGGRLPPGDGGQVPGAGGEPDKCRPLLHAGGRVRQTKHGEAALLLQDQLGHTLQTGRFVHQRPVHCEHGRTPGAVHGLLHRLRL
ncbi:sodium channel protein Nach-like [Pollicipes pollicipes]|uniref:sodium channel protein Nach-like n=1 Tax=Pollicipes pollicipes TaxID=41117 RepID=UPI0018857FEF|nr:sodium channel protein Nach-like [Pollicipes pollicipes]